MKMSIRTRLFVTVNFLIIFFVLGSWILNYNFLEKYYLSYNRQKLLDYVESIDKGYTGDPDDLTLEMEKLESGSGLSILVLNQNYEIKYRSRGNKNEDPLTLAPNQTDSTAPSFDPLLQRVKKIDPRIALVASNLDALLAGEQVFAFYQDPSLNISFLNVVSKLNNGDYILLSTPLAAIQESAAIANRFFLFSGLLTLIIGSIFAYIFARRFTRPILELKTIAQRMAKLDFTNKYISNNHDEVGQLGESINSLSDQLGKSITELQEANEKLKLDIEHERRIDEMRKEFISNVSHELKTPIALIQGYAEGLKVNIVEDEESKNFYCDVITDEAGKMNKMVRSLLDLSQIESGYFTLEKENFDLSLLVNQVLNKFEPILKEKGITLQGTRASGVMVDGDHWRIDQVLVNYLNNAINHTDGSREIRVDVKVTEAGSLADPNDSTPYVPKARVSVFNTGKPIPEDALDKVFQSFYKVDKARTRAYGGVGLGLSIVRAIMDLHQNDYGVRNLNDGVEFWFELDMIASTETKFMNSVTHC